MTALIIAFAAAGLIFIAAVAWLLWEVMNAPDAAAFIEHETEYDLNQ